EYLTSLPLRLALLDERPRAFRVVLALLDHLEVAGGDLLGLAIGSPRPWRIAILVPHTASGALVRSIPASSRARSISFSWGTTSVTRPTSYARRALIRSRLPRRAMRRQTASGMRRAMFTISCEET